MDIGEPIVPGRERGPPFAADDPDVERWWRRLIVPLAARGIVRTGDLVALENLCSGLAEREQLISEADKQARAGNAEAARALHAEADDASLVEAARRFCLHELPELESLRVELRIFGW